MSCKKTGGRVSGGMEDRQDGHIYYLSQSTNDEEVIKSQINYGCDRIVFADSNQTGSVFASGRCDALCMMTLTSLTYGLFVLCVSLTTVTAGKKL